MQLVERDHVTSFLLHYCTGAGKTIIAAGIIACAFLKLRSQEKEGSMKICISCPLAVRSQWKHVLANWLNIDAGWILEVKSRADLDKDRLDQARIVLLTRTLLSLEYEEAFSKDSSSNWTRMEGVELPPIYKMEFDRLIVDECHTLKNAETSWCASHAELSKNCKKRVGMSGTLVQSSMADLAGECQALRMPAMYCSETAWTDGERDRVNFDTMRSFESYKDDLSSEVLGLQPYKKKTVYFTLKLDAKAIASYNAVVKSGLELGARTDSEGGENSLTEMSRAVQILQSMPLSPLLPNYTAPELHSDPEKMKKVAACDGGALSSMVSLLNVIRKREDGGRVIVASAHTVDLKLLQSYLAQHKPEEKVFLFDGKLHDRSGMIAEFLSDELPTSVLLLSLAAGGTGVDIVLEERNREVENFGCTSIVFFGSRQYNAALEKQAIGRIYRIGQKRQVWAYHLLLKGGVDEAIGGVQKDKEGLSDAFSGNFTSFSSSSGSHTWRQQGGVLRSVCLLNEKGASILPTEGEMRARASAEAVLKQNKKKPRGTKMRVVPPHLRSET